MDEVRFAAATIMGADTTEVQLSTEFLLVHSQMVIKRR